MRVRELATELGRSAREVLQKCKDLGLEVVDSRLASLDTEQAEAIRRAFSGDGDERVAAQLSDTDSEAGKKPKKSRRPHVELAMCPRCRAALDETGRCPRCNYSAHTDTETLADQRHIALYGITQSGKTVFLASTLNRLLTMSRDELAVQLGGWRPSVPVGSLRSDTAEICRKVVQGEVIDPTTITEYREFQLSFRRRDGLSPERYIFKSFDLSGEVIADWVAHRPISEEMLARLSVSLAEAVGLILLIDPTHELRNDECRGLEDALWRSLIDRLIEESGEEQYDKPVVFVLTKCDLPDVAPVLGMPSREERLAAQEGGDKYKELTDRQDQMAEQFVRDRMPQIWVAIDPDDPRRRVTNWRIIAISSTGLFGAELREAGQLEPWRITDPFHWILMKLRPWRHRQARKIKAVVLVMLLGILAAVGKGFWDWNWAVRLEASARQHIRNGQPDKAVALLSKADRTWRLCDMSVLNRLRDGASARVEEQRIELVILRAEELRKSLEEHLAKGDIGKAGEIEDQLALLLEDEQAEECRTFLQRVQEYCRRKEQERLTPLRELVSRIRTNWNIQPEEALSALDAVLKSLKKEGPRSLIPETILNDLGNIEDLRERIEAALVDRYKDRLSQIKRRFLVGSPEEAERAAANLVEELSHAASPRVRAVCEECEAWMERATADVAVFDRLRPDLRSVNDKLRLAQEQLDSLAAKSALAELSRIRQNIGMFRATELRSTIEDELQLYRKLAEEIIEKQQQFVVAKANADETSNRGALREALALYEKAYSIHGDKGIERTIEDLKRRLDSYERHVKQARSFAAEFSNPVRAKDEYEKAIAVWPEGHEAIKGLQGLHVEIRERVSVLLKSFHKAIENDQYEQAWGDATKARALAMACELTAKLSEADQACAAVIESLLANAAESIERGDLGRGQAVAEKAAVLAESVGLTELARESKDFLRQILPAGVEWRIRTKDVQYVDDTGIVSCRSITYFYNTIEMAMVFVPDDGHNKAEFSANSSPVIRVRRRGFYIGATEVTQEQYIAIMGRGLPGWKRETGKHPAGGVTWDEAKEFCERLGARDGARYNLPTESQWETACRCGALTAFYCGEKMSRKYAHYRGDGLAELQSVPVGSYPANGYGIYDMHGNVWEWCCDTFRDAGGRSYGSVQKVRRGGSYLSREAQLRCDFRERLSRYGRRSDVGFRVVVESDTTGK